MALKGRGTIGTLAWHRAIGLSVSVPLVHADPHLHSCMYSFPFAWIDPVRSVQLYPRSQAPVGGML